MFELLKELMAPMTKGNYISNYDDLTAPPYIKEEYSPRPEYDEILNSLFMEPEPDPESKHEPPKVKQKELILAVVRKERKDYKEINQVNIKLDKKKKKKRRKRKRFVLTLKRTSKYRKNQNNKSNQTSPKIAITKKPRECDAIRKNKKC